MKKIFNYLLVLVSCAGLMTACNLDIAPEDSLTGDQMAASPTGMADVINGCYSTMKDWPGGEAGNYWFGRQFFQMADFAADDVVYASKTPDDLNMCFCYNERTAATANFTSFWTLCYQIIYATNVAFDIADRKEELSDEETYLLGEAQFLKAFIMHDLVRFYARQYTYDKSTPEQSLGIILRDGAADSGQKGRATVKETYEEILRLLGEAEKNMTAGSSDRASNKGLGSIGAVKALLSRVYLYMGEWDKCIAVSTELINNYGYELEDAESMKSYYTETFNRDETIWCLHVLASDDIANDSGSVAGMIYNGEGCWSEEGYSPSLLETMGINDVLHDYANTDVRFTFANADVVNKGLSFKSCSKFSEQDDIPTLTSPVYFRLSEAYFNRAESYAHKGDKANAIKDINAVRENRIIPAAGKDMSFYLVKESDITTNIVDLVLDQKRIEFCFEAHRLFDLLRNNKDIVRNYWGYHVAYQGEGTTDTSVAPGLGMENVVIKYTLDKVVYPIPSQEVINNPLAEQNPGY